MSADTQDRTVTEDPMPTEPTPSPCPSCEDIVAYVVCNPDDPDYGDEWPDLDDHMATCITCRILTRTLHEAMEESLGGTRPKMSGDEEDLS